ncbi:hypothetical protein [Oscillatoria sp. HE19RPO]|uniref:hypothetical protein n=1 Tax=Oscillatoria sp. HE19RPO TaxID=2954806 RepID=UPI0020C54346|nr:hypothetical protein [Oscillatoria sp. HE19RPO]
MASPPGGRHAGNAIKVLLIIAFILDTESGCQRSVKTRTLKGGGSQDEARLRGLKTTTDFYQPDLV